MTRGRGDHPELLHTVLDTTDVRGLAEFYRTLLGLRYRPGDDPPADGGPDGADYLVLTAADGSRRLAFAQVDRLEPTTWPEHDVPMQAHLDFTVESLESLHTHRARAEDLGARLLLDRADDPDEALYVLADPAGHPFCLLVAEPAAPLGERDAAGVLLAALAAFVEAVAGLHEVDLLDPARCRGWSRLDTLVHVRLGIEEMLLGTADRVEEPPDHDAVSYWQGFAADQSGGPDDPDDVDRVLFVRRAASAYRRPASAVRHLADVAAKAPAVVAGLPPGSVVAFQGQRLRAEDFLATWAVEVACHHLDLALTDGPAPPAAAVRLTLRTLEALAGQPLPAAWVASTPASDVLLAALGRTPWPDDVERPAGYPSPL